MYRNWRVTAVFCALVAGFGIFAVRNERIAFVIGGNNRLTVSDQPFGAQMKIDHVTVGSARGAMVVVQKYAGLPSNITVAHTQYLPKGTHRNVPLLLPPNHPKRDVSSGDTVYATLYLRTGGWDDPYDPDTRTPLRDWFGNIVTDSFVLR